MMLLCIVVVSVFSLVSSKYVEGDLHSLEIPKQEERLRAHFRIPPGVSLPATPDRVSNISREKFREYAIRGQPVIVTDAMRDWPGLSKWNCNYFHHAFPNEDVGGFSAYKADSLKWRRKLGDPWFLTAREKLGIPDEEADAKNPDIMSWYFSALGVDGARGHEVERNQTVVDTLKADFHLPYFLEPSQLNNDTLYGRLEFFFGTDGAGVHPHTDPVCQWIFSGQTSGKKFWRLALPYNIDLLEKSNPGYKFRAADGNTLLAIMINKAPLYEFMLSAGEMIFFPPGMIHSTRATGPECSTSLSLQFGSPNPVMYLKEFSADLVSDVIGASKCYVDHFNAWLFGASFPTPDARPSDLRQFADSRFEEMDADQSGAISLEEALVFMRELQQERGSPGGVIKDDPQLDADSFLLAHDTNTDGLVSKSEFDSILFSLWTPRMAKVAAATSKTQPVSFFFKADGNSDDYVTEEEFRKAYPHISWSAVLEFDDDKDGKLFQGEFHNHTRKLYKLLSGESYDPDAAMDGSEDADEENEEEDWASRDDLPKPTLPLVDEPAEFPGGIKALQLKLDHEEALRKLWQISEAQGQLPVSPTVVSKLSESTFRELAERGVPLIVADGLTAATDASRLTCEVFKRELSSEPVKLSSLSAWKTLGETDDSQPGRYWEYQALGQNTQIGGEPYVRTVELEKRMQDATEIPYFLPKSEVNRLLHEDHLHFFFGTQDGTRGAFSDMNCFWSVFGQVHGSSHWKLTIPYNVRQLQGDNPGYTHWPGDGPDLVARMVAEHPVYEFSLKAGQLLVLPPGLLKHFVMTDAGACSVLFRSAFMDPAPVGHVRSLVEPLMSDSEGAAGCYTDHYNKWLFGSPLPDSDGSPEGNELYANGIFAAMDADGNNAISLTEAVAYFPPKSVKGAIRTPELDGDAFMVANDADRNGTVSFDELATTISALWSPVMHEVGGMWYFIDTMNALAGGGWPDYGRYVDSIRFNFNRLLDVDDEGKVQSQKAPSSALPSLFPSNHMNNVPVPAGFPISVDRVGDEVIVARPQSDGVGFLLWPRLRKAYVGAFKNGKRLGTGVFCCKGTQVFDQLWKDTDDDGTSFLTEPKSDELVEDQSNLEVVDDVEGLLWMGSVDVNGICAVLWKNSGHVFVGSFVNGKREGPGVMLNPNGERTLVNWLAGQDETDWTALLQLPVAE